jgi:uncharacterized protein
VSVVADSGAIYALYDASDSHHAGVAAFARAQRVPLIIPAAILAEIDYLILRFLGPDAELAFLDDLIAGVYAVEAVAIEDLVSARATLSRYRELRLGLSDCIVAAAAERRGIFRILTVDERHFRAIRSSTGRPFTLVPADELETSPGSPGIS